MEEQGFIRTEAYGLPTTSCCKNVLYPDDAPADMWTGQSASNQGKRRFAGK